MSRKYKFHDQTKPYFVSFAVVNWIDVFVRFEYSKIILESLAYCMKHKGMLVYSWCIMPSHVHLIFGTNDLPMQDVLRDLKRHTSKALKEKISCNSQESRREWMLNFFQNAGSERSNNSDWQFWQQNNHPIELDSHEIIEQKLNYIHENPVKAGFVENPEDWLLSSAKDYAGKKGLLDGLIVD